MLRFVFLAAALLTGCASTVTLDAAPDAELATLSGRSERGEGLAAWRWHALLAVDDTPVRHAFMSDPCDTVVRVGPGERRLVVQTVFNNGFGGDGPWQAIVPLRASLRAGRHYRLNGTVRDNLCLVWIEEVGTGAKVGGDGAAPYASRRSPSRFVPIYIPAR